MLSFLLLHLLLINTHFGAYVHLDKYYFDFTGVAYTKYDLPLHRWIHHIYSSDFYTDILGENHQIFWNFRRALSCTSIPLCPGNFVAVVIKDGASIGLGTTNSEQTTLLPDAVGVFFACLYHCIHFLPDSLLL